MRALRVIIQFISGQLEIRWKASLGFHPWVGFQFIRPRVPNTRRFQDLCGISTSWYQNFQRCFIALEFIHTTTFELLGILQRSLRPTTSLTWNAGTMFFIVVEKLLAIIGRGMRRDKTSIRFALVRSSDHEKKGRWELPSRLVQKNATTAKEDPRPAKIYYLKWQKTRKPDNYDLFSTPRTIYEKMALRTSFRNLKFALQSSR